MGNKLGFLAGLGAGAYLALKLNPQQAEKVRNLATSLKDSAPVRRAGQTASETVGKTIRKQGAAFTDHVAQQIKTKFFDQNDAETPGVKYGQSYAENHTPAPSPETKTATPAPGANSEDTQ